MVEHPQQPNPSPQDRQEGPRQEHDDDAGGERIAKALARAGVASRRDVERLIEAGRVALNGQVLTSPAVRVGKDDILTVDGAVVAGAEPTRLWRYHKPTGLVTTNKDPQGRPTVFEHLPAGLPRVISIGRLDLNSEGLLLLTNDGGLARALELPSSGWKRIYRVRAYGQTSQVKLDALRNGVTVEGVQYGAIEAKLDKVQTKIIDGQKAAANLWITVSLNEGKNREVRRVLESIGLKVNRLIRLAYGPFALGTLPIGAAEEVGPRVIREQLADFIAPQNMPKAERRTPGMLAPAPSAERRAPKPAPPGARGRAEADPRTDSSRGPGFGRDGKRPTGKPVGRQKPPGPGVRRDDRKEKVEGETEAYGRILPAPKTLPGRGPRPRTVTAETKAAELPEKKVYKAGWAKPKSKPRPAPAGSKPKRRGPPKAP